LAAAEAARAARLAETEAETRKLSEAVRSLHSDRDQLLARIALLERSLDDVTGSIRRQSAALAAVPTPPPPIVQVPTTDMAVRPVVSPAEADANGSGPEAQGTVEGASASADATAVLPVAEPQPMIGVDIGGSANFGGLRVLWKSTTTQHGELVEGLHPVVVARENIRTRSVELRLVVGPLPDREAAAQLCAVLTATRRYCQPAPYEGRPLELTAPPPVPQPVRRSSATSERKAAPSRPRGSP
jgi:hypothetical protein